MSDAISNGMGMLSFMNGTSPHNLGSQVQTNAASAASLKAKALTYANQSATDRLAARKRQMSLTGGGLDSTLLTGPSGLSNLSQPNAGKSLLGL